MSKGDITVRPDTARDARLDRIAEYHGKTKNVIIGEIAHELSRTKPEHYYEVLAAIETANRRLREKR
ncbi:MAG: hypothetical protein H7343_10175 [Undibacterium sp.]|nr:hypothetical protein [Opitutaceae bacterium]